MQFLWSFFEIPESRSCMLLIASMVYYHFTLKHIISMLHFARQPSTDYSYLATLFEQREGGGQLQIKANVPTTLNISQVYWRHPVPLAARGECPPLRRARNTAHRNHDLHHRAWLSCSRGAQPCYQSRTPNAACCCLEQVRQLYHIL